MNPIGIRQAVQNLPQLIKYTPDNCEETIIVSDSGSVVMIDQHEWKKVRETLRLFCDKKSLNALSEGHKNREYGVVSDSVSVEEAFYDMKKSRRLIFHHFEDIIQRDSQKHSTSQNMRLNHR
ncbi:MAG TPA: hypothetical protein DCQ37_19335 [Desulfobacteraceae bacterium]|nr:hypothetical protein [Desulfobacteraceae bacterium]